MKNGVIMQYFEWNLPNDGQLWRKLKRDAKNLHHRGITAVWIPPAYKAYDQSDQGYATYDLFDLGEFDQKGGVRTKYGTKKELEEMITELHKYQISVYLDAVMNHKIGADSKEEFLAIEVNPSNRLETISEEKKIDAWTGYDFIGRKGSYSDFKWNYERFTGIEILDSTQNKHIYRITGENKQWSEDVDSENGNFDFLMGNNIDHQQPEVISELNKWGSWVANELQLDGMRLDAIKHISRRFMLQFVENMRQNYRKNFYFVGEYWKADAATLMDYLSAVGKKIDLFDVPLHFNFHTASKMRDQYDLREIFSNSLVAQAPTLAVTFVDNHDSQEGSSLASEVEDWFKPHAYALILLQKDGYPCLFYGDYYGIGEQKPKYQKLINTLLHARKYAAYGEETFYYTAPNVIGFVRSGDTEHQNSGIAVLLSNSQQASSIWMNVGAKRAGEVWTDLTKHFKQSIKIGKEGYAEFPVSAQNISVWVKEKSKHKKQLGIEDILQRIRFCKKK